MFYKDGNLLVNNDEPTADELKTLHKTIKKVTFDIENFSYNTSVSAFMICVNELFTLKCSKKAILEPLVILLAPFAPHIAEDLWQKVGESGFVSVAPWPKYDETLAKADVVTIAVQVNGKTRAKIDFDADADQAQVEAAAKADASVAKVLAASGEIKKVIFVKNRIVNFII